jgi:hypothetical protein
MWDILTVMFYLALGAFSLAGLYARAGAIAGSLEEGHFSDGF